MRLKNWLLTGTSLGILAFAPLGVRAQDAGLAAAYQAYIEAQASGDEAATDAARDAFAEACIAAGYSSVDECTAAATGAAGPAVEPEAQPEPEPAPEPEAVEEPAPEPEPVPEPEPAPAEEAAPAEEPAPVEEPVPEVTEEPAPVEEPAPEPEAVEEPAPEVVEEPAPEPEPVEEPAPEPTPEAVPVEEPAPVPEEPAEPAPEVVEEPAPAPAQEPAPAEEAAPVEEPAPIEQPAPAEEVAPTQEPAPAEEIAPAEETAPQEEPAPAEEPTAGADISAALSAQVDIYNGAIADMMAGGDPAAAGAEIDAARAEMEVLCTDAGYPSLEACLAEHGITLPAVPAIDQPAEQPAPEAPAPTEPTPVEPAPGEPVAEQPAPDTPVDEAVEPVETLPEGVSAEDLAPVLDSDKDATVAPVEGEQPVEGQPAPEVDASAEAPPPAEPVAPPTSDVEAQASFQVEQDAIVSATQETGERVEFQALEPVAVPQNVTIINQTNVTNTNITNTNVTNNVTNNVQNNTVNVNYGDVLTQVIVEVGNQLIINNRGQDTSRFVEYDAEEVYYERLGNGRIRETVLRPDGSQIVTVRNRNGDILRRSRITPDGREYVLAWFDDRYDDDLLEWRDPARELPPLRLNIPVSEYVLDAGRAEEDQIELFFAQPPVEQVTRLYSIDEVKRSARVRDMVRRLEVGNLTFDTGSANVGRDQVANLSAVAGAMLGLLESNPAETFLIEGHTDAVGSDISNLQLSDARAGTVARILTDFYGVPPENLATQGYGERYLKIRTELDERENRRVTIRRITPLITPYVASAR